MTTTPLYHAVDAEKCLCGESPACTQGGGERTAGSHRYPATSLCGHQWRHGNHPPVLLKLLVAAGANLKATRQDGRNALHLAAAAKSPEAVQFLLDQKMGVNALSDLSETALMNAAAAGRLETVTLLLRVGASVNGAESNAK
jgi:ankyrin repeat protein